MPTAEAGNENPEAIIAFRVSAWKAYFCMARAGKRKMPLKPVICRHLEKNGLGAWNRDKLHRDAD
jgi:hypothetical protein